MSSSSSWSASASSWSSRIFRGARGSAPNHDSSDSDRFGLARSPSAKIKHPALHPFPPHLRALSSPSPAPSFSSSTTTIQPPPSMVATPHQYNSSHDMDDEGECPVCLEPLSFSFRLPGEKPHIVPECGHALHEVSHLYPILFPFRSLHTLGLLQRRLRPPTWSWSSRSPSQVQPWRMWCMQTPNEGP